MEKPSPEFGFTHEEWEACIKVLSALKDSPFDNPDNERFGTLLTKIYKNAKKDNRKESYSLKKAEDLAVSLDTEIAKNALRGSTLFTEGKAQTEPVFTALRIPKNCYACNASYANAHFFYNRLCEACATLHYEKRFRGMDLAGRRVILTGGRVKVGFATALKLLRNHAQVTLTTRFPALALQQFQQEADYARWADSLTVYGLDLRNLRAVEDFLQYYRAHHDSLDMLINNAAQTIKYTDEYYFPLSQNEQKALDALAPGTRLVANATSVSKPVRELEYQSGQNTPVNLNRFGQPVDGRDKTSWNSRLDEISMHELVEVNLINQISPYFLLKELKPLLKQSPFGATFIINVTSAEGIFSYGNRTGYHPHTNMTKAALNMMTLTSAQDFAKDKIYMNCVDVGWISTGAKESLREKQFEKGYIPPLDPVDGAARILDPIFEALNGNVVYGALLKNYKISDW